PSGGRRHFLELHQHDADRSDRGYRTGPRQAGRQQQPGGALGLRQEAQVGACSAPSDAVARPADAAHGCVMDNLPLVMRGLDPRIHPSSKEDGLPGHKRVYARLRRAMPGNDDRSYRRKNVTTYLGRLAGAAAFLTLFVAVATAQPYPTRQITLVVPFAPGGPADFLGRLIGQKMSEDLGQQIVVANRPGANTIIGAQAVAKASPDGYTLLMAIDGTLVMNPFLYSKLAYDPFKDFVPISLIALVPSAVVGNINIPVNSIKELVEQEKAKPGT